MIIMNEKIKALEVQLTGLNGEDLGVVPTSEALAMAKKQKVDLVCTSLMASPPFCRLIGAGAAKQEAQQARKQEREPKVKEIRLTPQIEDHDYDTKKLQAERILKAGDAVLFVVKIQGKEGDRAKELLETLLKELSPASENKIIIEMTDEASMENHSIPFTIDGYRQLAEWLEHQLGACLPVRELAKRSKRNRSLHMGADSYF